jgi:hypothetical protein
MCFPEKERSMMTKLAWRLAIALFCTLGPTAACLAADEPVKTTETRDTLLYVRTDPPGATVFLDGKRMSTAGNLLHVAPGEVTLRVELDGYQSDIQQVTISANRITRVELTLRPAAKKGDGKGTAPLRPNPPDASGDQPVASKVTLEGGRATRTPAMTQNLPRLTYQFRRGKQYAYQIKIEAELEDTIETHEGVSTYDVLSADDRQMVLKQSGTLGVQTQMRPGHMTRIRSPRFPSFFGPHGFPGFGPTGPAGITIDHQGHLVLSKPLTHLPFLLGDLETLVIEELPADGKLSWQRLRDVLAIERQSSGFPPFGPHRGESQSERPAKEQSDYAVVDSQADAARVTKTYSFRSAPEGNAAPRFEMTGSGEFTFDRQQGVIRLLSMKYKINVNEPNLTLRVPVTLSCRLLTAEELVAHKKEEEDTSIAAEKANAPKPVDRAERMALLRTLRSADPERAKAAAERLAKAVVDDDPAPVAKALVLLLHNSNEWVQRAAAKALSVWGTPEAEDALIQASTKEDFWVRTAAIEALAKLKSEKAADAIAAQMYRNRHEAGVALKLMGPVAENATIGCLKDRDEWVRHEACQVLAEIGGQPSLKALREFAERVTSFDAGAATQAIAVIEKRAEAGDPKTGQAGPAAGGRPIWRTWHDASGVFEVVATLVGVEDGKLTLKKRDGRTLVVPLDRLSKSDQAYARRHSQAK